MESKRKYVFPIYYLSVMYTIGDTPWICPRSDRDAELRRVSHNRKRATKQSTVRNNGTRETIWMVGSFRLVLTGANCTLRARIVNVREHRVVGRCIRVAKQKQQDSPSRQKNRR